MCDTFVARGSVTSTGNLVFGKNSDREPNEAQAVVRIPAKQHKESRLKTTFIEIDQVSRTNDVILSKPFHMWGAEMGVNEHGLVIGNEALFTKVPIARKNSGLTGMDMLRLALERTSTAGEALELITRLNEKYGQDACGGYEDRNFFYHNSFIIADLNDAWVLETAGPFWVAEQVNGFRSISNGITIESEYDASSPNIEDRALKDGYLKKGETFNFRKAFSAPFMTSMSMCTARQGQTTKLGKDAAGSFGVKEAAVILRSHTDENDFSVSSANMKSVCLHASGLRTPSQTTGSMIAEIPKSGAPFVFVTGTAAPCLSLFKRVRFESNDLLSADKPGHSLPAGYNEPSAKADDSLWWVNESFHRSALRYYAVAEKDWKPLRDEIEEKVLDVTVPAAEFEAAVKDHYDLIEKGKALLKEKAGSKEAFHPLYRLYWNRMNSKARLPKAGLT